MNSHDHLSADLVSPPAVAPFVLEPTAVERIWGTYDLAPWYAGPTPEGPVGEIWLTAEDCRVAEGDYAGQTLAEVTAASPAAFGDERGEGFPLLIKLLLPREKLSVQVHPDDAQAQLLGMPRGKTECWYVLSAEPGAQVAVGLQRALSKDELRSAIRDGSLESELRMLPVKAGDMVFVDAGTVHAIGPGMVVLETQQYSDTTYRLWDYGRPRELHVDAGADATKTETAAGLAAPATMDGFTRLVACDYFAVDRFDVRGHDDMAQLGAGDRLQILIALNEGCELRSEEGHTQPLPRAKAVVLPASGANYALGGDLEVSVIRILKP